MVTHRIQAHYALPLRWLPKSSLQGEPKINNFRGVQLLHPIFEPNRALVTTKTSLITHNSLNFEREICFERQIYFDWFLCSLLIIYKPNLPDSRRSQHIAFKDMAVQCFASINHSEICSNRRNSWWHLVLASVYIISYQDTTGEWLFEMWWKRLEGLIMNVYCSWRWQQSHRLQNLNEFFFDIACLSW